jgi:hypothetical protein
LFVKRGLVIAASFSVRFDQAKHRIRPAVPGHGDGRGDAWVRRGSSGKGAGTDDAGDRATARKRRRVGSRGGNIMGWSIADVCLWVA